MDFGAVISRALRITWDHKVLWLLGFLAALGAGGAGNLGQSPQSAFRMNGDNGNVPPWMQDFARDPSLILAGASAFFCLVAIISIVLFVVGIIARGGLIAGVQQIETAGNTTFGRAWSVGAARFWRLLGLNILLAIPVIILVVILIATVGGTAMAAIASSAGQRGDDNNAALASLLGGGVIVLCCLVCVLAIYGVLSMAIQTFGERAIVLENAGVMDSIGRGWAVFRANLGNIILIALIMWVIATAFAFVVGAIVAAVLFASVFPAINDLSQSGSLGAGPTILAIIGVILATVVGAIINTLFTTFNSTAWTLAFRQFTGSVPAVPAPAAQPPLPAA